MELLEPLQYKTIVLKLRIDCQGCVKEVTKILKKINGVYDIHVDMDDEKVTVRGNVEIDRLIKKLGEHNKHAQLLSEIEGNKAVGKKDVDGKRMENQVGSSGGNFNGENKRRSSDSGGAAHKEDDHQPAERKSGKGLKHGGEEDDYAQNATKPVGGGRKSGGCDQTPTKSGGGNGSKHSGGDANDSGQNPTKPDGGGGRKPDRPTKSGDGKHRKHIDGGEEDDYAQNPTKPVGDGRKSGGCDQTPTKPGGGNGPKYSGSSGNADDCAQNPTKPGGGGRKSGGSSGNTDGCDQKSTKPDGCNRPKRGDDGEDANDCSQNSTEPGGGRPNTQKSGKNLCDDNTDGDYTDDLSAICRIM